MPKTKIQYDKWITFKKGSIVLLATTVAGILAEFVIGGNVQIESPVAAAVVLSVAKMVQNYLKHREQ